MKTHLSLFGAATLVVICPSKSISTPSPQDWPVYLGGKERNLFSPLTQINRENVNALEVAWQYDTGHKSEYQANNLIIGEILYTPTATREIVALNAATGKTLWKWDP
ncbi:MAG: pyrroloquinoline quinone-dependent dehydrogenase, partial [Roseibacillus sp.]|nr:pyrroloquinoline quinone-dependent dehydrogenase [Roseibacillus sp.]